MPVLCSERIPGQRIMLRPPQLDDAAELFEGITCDPEAARYMRWEPHTDVGQTRRMVAQRMHASEGDQTWIIALQTSGDVVGFIRCSLSTRDAVEIGCCLGRRWWGTGLMSEAFGLMLAALEADAHVKRVWATCDVDNSRSARLLERCGFAFEGRLARYGVFPMLGAEPRDCLLYAKGLR
ncbi:GNAT family N-acetyltransferase [Mycobacterium gordonae]|uniref:GNAT family acetyltransferase n=2 Tax=Mycobacterium gordonae TaxID=1778 RepID=A0A1X1X721_MYCGO|nr:GNAT family N-acetyltransferase [Mycobacterium gordonae]MCV7006948.1 GNAT family N-acetyltransferase [Mycobacterium gordonae]ODR21905.1 GNAT family N-acetyltransferase [Mycobacterium gordonae]ORV94473.1 GNAT family acetyltransferase [Mycobacterium gordonae]